MVTRIVGGISFHAKLSSVILKGVKGNLVAEELRKRLVFFFAFARVIIYKSLREGGGRVLPFIEFQASSSFCCCSASEPLDRA